MAEAWTTVVETEPEWDDNTRGLVDGLAQYEENVHRCGLHRSVLEDPANNRFIFEVDECEMCAAIAAKQRALADEDAAWASAHPHPQPRDRRPADGRELRLRRMTPDEIEQAEQKAQTREAVGRGGSSRKRQRRG